MNKLVCFDKENAKYEEHLYLRNSWVEVLTCIKGKKETTKPL